MSIFVPANGRIFSVRSNKRFVKSVHMDFLAVQHYPCIQYVTNLPIDCSFEIKLKINQASYSYEFWCRGF